MNKGSVSDFLQRLGEERQDLFLIVDRLRQMILASGPGITEEVKYGGILFSSRVGFCGVFPYKAHVTLEFGEGASLPDPHGLLAGSGKHRRNIKIRTLLEIEDKKVAEYVEMARQAADA